MSGAIVVVKVKRTRAAEKHVQERVSQNLCVACNGNKPFRRRGLCTTCEGRWERSRKEMSKEQRATFDAKLIEQGLLLDNHDILKLRSKDNPFAQLADEMRG
jgi:hypothetical protein